MTASNPININSLTDLVAKAVERRGALLKSYEMVRIVASSGDGLPGIVMDKYGPALVVRAEQDSSGGQLLEELEKCAAAICEASNTSSLVLFENDGTRSRIEPKLVYGSAITEVVLSEGPCKFLIKPAAQFNAGFFIDMRDVRSLIRELSPKAKVFNGFCFTGSLGIAALKGGAALVTQVDISKSALNWARENLALNEISSEQGCKFIAEDCIKFMEREARRIAKGAEPYQLVILDPPTFGTTSGVTFSIKKEFDRLCDLALAILAPVGTVIFTTNWSELQAQDVLARLKRAANDSGRRIEKESVLLPPNEDFPTRSSQSSAMRGGCVRLNAR